MKVLFVSSGNFESFNVAPFIKSQGESLKNIGVDMHYFPIKSKGLWGYIKHIKPLRKRIREINCDLIHAHYSLCGIITLLATSRPIVLSLMGSDVNGSAFWRQIIRLLSLIFKFKIIVKSEEMKRKLTLKQTLVIPNGVDLSQFKELDREECRKKLGLPIDNRYILFAAIADRPVKNYDLAKTAFELVKREKMELLAVTNISHDQIPVFINAADVLILTSLWEGSPNIIKEAMACNCPIVSTEVGDVKWLLGDLQGHYIAQNDPQNFADKIDKALQYGRRTKGRSRIMELEIDSETIAKRINDIYSQILYEKKINQATKN